MGFVLLIAVVAMPAFSYLPQASVAGLLVFASVRMAPISYIVSLWRTDKGSCALLIFTTLVCVFRDPVGGLVVGMIFALLRDAAGTAYGHAHVFALPASTEIDRSKAAGAGFDRAAVQLTVDLDNSPGLVQSDMPLTVLIQYLRRSIRPCSSGADGLEYSVGCKTVVYQPVGAFVYLAVDRHAARLQFLRRLKPATMILSLEKTTHVDVDGMAGLGKAVQQLRDDAVNVEVVIPRRLSLDLAKTVWIQELERLGNVHCADAVSPLLKHVQVSSKEGGEESSEETQAASGESSEDSSDDVRAVSKGKSEEHVCIHIDQDVS